MSNTFAYRASPELATALRDLSERIRVFHDEVIRPWEETNSDVNLVWHRRLGYEIKFLGFAVAAKGIPVPDGLSSNRGRHYLIPRRGKGGDPWRSALEMFNQRPELSPVLRQFGVEPTFLVPDRGRLYHLGLRALAGSYYLTWGHEHPNPGPHLTPVPLSEYYLAVEAADTGNEKSVTHG